MLNRCRARLGEIVRDLDPERFEILFSRTLSRIPLEELADLMAGESFGPLDAPEEERLDRVVTQGLEEWRSTDRNLRDKMDDLEKVARGPLQEADLESALVRLAGAEPVAGWRRIILQEGSRTASAPPSAEPKSGASSAVTAPSWCPSKPGGRASRTWDGRTSWTAGSSSPISCSDSSSIR